MVSFKLSGIIAVANAPTVPYAACCIPLPKSPNIPVNLFWKP
nr:MAG TPA: Protein of unknown function (DUF3304) [Caudoviricetes sp.]